MKKAEKGKAPAKKGAKTIYTAVGFFAAAGIICGAIWMQRHPAPLDKLASAPYTPRPKGSVTFSKDIAPIVWNRCTTCHREGQSAPFKLVEYTDFKKRLEQIGDVTASRYMPPWLPEPGFGKFAHERRLTETELGLIQQWVADGGPEGNPFNLPAQPQWTEGWQLGKPDLVVQAPSPFVLGPDGKDVYRNLVVKIPSERRRFVRGVEFLPGNARVVHHAFVQVDPTPTSRRLASGNPAGFDGMDLPETAMMPGGQFTSWQPGKVFTMPDERLAWVLEPGSDLVLQMHMNPSGKPEEVLPSVGFYFTEKPPELNAFRLKLQELELEIPAGTTNYQVERTYTLPVDLSLSRVGAHAHYLAREIRSFALLPSGAREELLYIKDWDFKWQGDYEYAAPVELPRGTRIVMQFTFDNSTNNVRNPSNPPVRVIYGLNSSDEMAELYFQALPKSPDDLTLLATDYSRQAFEQSINYYLFRLKLDPRDVLAHIRMGRYMASQGKAREAFSHLIEAIKIDKTAHEAHYELGVLYLRANEPAEAYKAFRSVLTLKPDDYQAAGSLAAACLRLGRNDEARKYAERALSLNPEDTIAAGLLKKIEQAEAAATN